MIDFKKETVREVKRLKALMLHMESMYPEDPEGIELRKSMEDQVDGALSEGGEAENLFFMMRNSMVVMRMIASKEYYDNQKKHNMN